MIEKDNQRYPRKNALDNSRLCSIMEYIPTQLYLLNILGKRNEV